MKLIKLRGTRGNWSMGIKLPNYNYKPKLSKQEKNRQHVKEYYQDHPDKLLEHYEYVSRWKERNPDKVKELARMWFISNGKEYYEKNKPRILKNQKDYYYRSKNQQQEGYQVKSGSKS